VFYTSIKRIFEVSSHYKKVNYNEEVLLAYKKEVSLLYKKYRITLLNELRRVKIDFR
jgi:hypothetical protein